MKLELEHTNNRIAGTTNTSNLRRILLKAEDADDGGEACADSSGDVVTAWPHDSVELVFSENGGIRASSEGSLATGCRGGRGEGGGVKTMDPRV